MLAVPIGVHAEPAKRVEPDVAAQFANTLTTIHDGDRKTPRAPKLVDVTAPKAELPGGRSDEPKLGDGQHVAAPRVGHLESTFAGGEALGQKPAEYRPVRGSMSPTGVGAMTRPNVGHPHRAKLVSFEPDQLRGGSRISNQVDALVRSWKTAPKWDAITVDGYAAARGRSEAENLKLGQRNADEVRAYLVRHGVPGEFVIAVGHASGVTGAKIEISGATCDGVTLVCRGLGTAK